MDGGMFVLIDSDVEEEELNLIAKKLKKQYRKTEKKKREKTLSLPSSPAPSSPPDSDTASVTSVRSSPCTSCSQQRGKLKRKTNPEEEPSNKLRKPAASQKNKSLSLTQQKNPVVLNSVSAFSLKNSSCDVVHAGTDSSEEDSIANDREFKISARNRLTLQNGSVVNEACRQSLSHTTYANTESISGKTTTSLATRVPVNGEKVFVTSQAHLSHDTHTIGQKKLSSSGSRTTSQATTSGHATKIQATTNGNVLHCVTRCRSCSEYCLPVLSSEDHSEMADFVGLDCEFVGVGPKNKSALGRCSIVDQRGAVLFDRFVKPEEPVTDYRTRWSGLRPRNLKQGIPFVVAQEQIAQLIKDKTVVGHAVHNDFKVLGVPHPVQRIRDTASCRLLREMADLPGNACALRKLTQVLLGRTIQQREHCSVTDARASLDLYRLVRTRWEPVLRAKFERREARYTPDGREVGSEAQPRLNTFLDDEYWPSDMFAESY